MSWLRTGYVLVTLLAAGFSLWGARFVWRRRAAPGGWPFCQMMLALAVWNLSAGLEALSSTPQHQGFWARCQYLGFVMLAPTFILFVMQYLRLAQHGARSNVLLFLFPAATLLVMWSNDWHHWLWTSAIFDPLTQLTTYRNGPWFWAHAIYAYSLIIAGGLALLWMAVDFSSQYRLQMLAVIVAVLTPLVSGLLYLYARINTHGLDPTPVFFALGGQLLLLGLFHFQLIDLQPVTSHILLNSLPEAVLVIDRRRRLVEMNRAAAQLLDLPLHKAAGLPVFQAALGFPELSGLLQGPPNTWQAATLRDLRGRWYEVRVAPLNDHQSSNAKQLITLHDTTTAKQVEADLAHQTADLESVAEISLAIATTLDRSHIARTIVELTRQHFHYYAAQIFLTDPDGRAMLLTAASGPTQPDYRPGQTEWIRTVIPIGQEKSIIARVVRQRSGLIVNNVRTEPTFLPHHLLPNTRAEMTTPIIYGDQVVGVLDVQSDQQDSFSQQDLDVLMTLAAQSAVALQNARYFDQLLERQRQLSLLNEMARSGSAASELEGMLQTLADQMGKLINADACYIILWDEQNQSPIGFAASGQLTESSRLLQLLPGKPTLMEHVLRTGQPQVIPDIHQSPYVHPNVAALLSVKATLALPLLAGQKKFGAAMLSFNELHPFTEAEISICEQAAGQISLEIAKTYALEEAQRQAREAEILRQAGAAVAATLDKNEAIRRILEQVHRVIPYDSASVSLLMDEQTLEIVGGYGFSDIRAVIGIRFNLDENSPSTLVVQTRQPVIIADAPTQYDAFRHPPHNHIRGWLGIPLIVKDKLIGTISIDSIHPGAFNAQHARLAVAIADQVAIALENARLFEDTQRLAITDSLTGLYNRRHFFILARREFERSLRYRRLIAAVMIDIDHFKRINDTYGHHVGDQVLQALTRLCLESSRQSDLIGRYGGEEFVILMPETNLDQAYQGAERLRQLIAHTPIETRAGPIQVTISLGVHSFSPEHGCEGTIDSEIERLIDRADQALLLSKSSGRNRVTIWNR